MELVTLERSTVQMSVHDKEACRFPERCVIHNMSDHSMREFTQHWRSDRGLMERTCDHGIGHPDPDSAYFMRHVMTSQQYVTEMVHGCDGCCAGAYN